MLSNDDDGVCTQIDDFGKLICSKEDNRAFVNQENKTTTGVQRALPRYLHERAIRQAVSESFHEMSVSSRDESLAAPTLRVSEEQQIFCQRMQVEADIPLFERNQCLDYDLRERERERERRGKTDRRFTVKRPMWKSPLSHHANVNVVATGIVDAHMNSIGHLRVGPSSAPTKAATHQCKSRCSLRAASQTNYS